MPGWIRQKLTSGLVTVRHIFYMQMVNIAYTGNIHVNSLIDKKINLGNDIGKTFSSF